MDEYITYNYIDIFYNYMETFIFTLYLIFIFLCIQIWFLWKDIDKNELKIKQFFNDSFFTKNCIYVFSFSVFFIIQGFPDGVTIPGAYLKILEMLALVGLVLFVYEWYSMLETCTHKRSLPQELTNFRYFFKRD